MAGALTKLLGSALYGGSLGAGTGALNAYLMGKPVLPELGPAAVGGAAGAIGGHLGSRFLSRGVTPTLRPFLTNPEGPGATRGRALTQFADVLHDDELTTDSLRNRHGADPNLPLTFADTGGVNTLGRAGAAARTPGPSQNNALQMVKTRQRLYPQFVLDAVRQNLTPSYDLKQTSAALKKTKEDDAKKLYDAALYDKDPTTGELTPKIVSDPTLDPLLDRLHAVGAFKKAEQLAKAYGEPAPKPLTDPDPATGTPGKYFLTGRQADLLKQGLDGLIGKTYGSAEPDRALGRAYTQLKHEYVGTLDPLLPGYDKAREVFSNHSTSQDALEAGRKFDSGHVDDQLDYFSSLDPGDQDFFRVGMGQRINDMVGEPGATTNRTRKFFNNDPTNKSAAFFRDPASYQAFTDQLGKVADMAETDAKIYGNSATQQRLTEEESMKHADVADSPLMRIFSPEGGGDIWSRLGAEGLRMMTADPDAVHKLTAAELTNITLNPKYHENMQLLNELDKRQRNQRVKNFLGNVAGDAAVTGGAIGGGTYESSAPPNPDDPEQWPDLAPQVTKPPGLAEGGRVGSPLAQQVLDQLTPEGRANADTARRSDAVPADLWTRLFKANNEDPLAGAREYSEAEKQADSAYAAEREVGGSDEYAARRLAPLSETSGDWTGSHRYLTPGGRAIDYGPGDSMIPGSDELYSALRATRNSLTGEGRPQGGGWGDDYDGLLADRRNAGEHWQQAHPGQAVATLAAPLAGYGALSRLMRGLPRVARGAATLAGTGGLYGFAGGEGGLGPRLKNAARGAAFGLDVPGIVDRWRGM